MDFLAPAVAYGGDFEVEGSASGALRALAGAEEVMTHTGEPSWTGFALEGAFSDVGG